MYIDNTTVCNLYAIIMLPFYHVIFVLMLFFFFVFVFYASELYIVLFVLHMP